MKVLNHPPYSPDLSPCDFFVFPRLKKMLSGNQYTSRSSLGSAIYQCLKQIPKEDYLSVFRDWVKRLQKCWSIRGILWRFVIKICLIKRSTEVIQTQWQNFLQDPHNSHCTSADAMQNSYSTAIATRTTQHEVWWKLAQRKIGPGEVVQRCGLTDGRTDNDQGVITIAHPATAVHELKWPPFTEAFPWEMVPPPPNPSPWNASVKVVFFFFTSFPKNNWSRSLVQ